MRIKTLAHHSRKSLPDLGNKVLNSIPSHRSVGDAPEPPHQIGRCNVRVEVEVVRHGNLAVLEGRGDESDPELCMNLGCRAWYTQF